MKATGYLILAMGLFAVPVAAEPAATDVVVRSAKGRFDDVKDRVLMAIENRGMVLNNTAHVGDMLERTGRDLGRKLRIYARADVLEFCNAVLSRATMEADPHNIVFCPYTIAIYVLPNEPDRVYLSYRKPASGGSVRSVKALAAVEKLLDAIVREALD